MDITYLDFFTSMCAPVLEDLTLGPPFSLITFPKLKALQLTYETLPVPISSDALTSLALTGGAEQWDLQRDDIHFPLETLSLRVTDPAVIAAIVAPKLGYVPIGWVLTNFVLLCSVTLGTDLAVSTRHQFR